MALRTSDPTYLSELDKWYSVLLPKLVPMLYKNGGPVITVQVENEYGSYYACDFQYTAHLRDLLKKYLGNDVVLFTTDGSGDGYLQCGRVDNAFATVDFGPGGDPNPAFDIQHTFQEFGPSVNSEFYAGWLDHWAEPHSTVATKDICYTLDKMLLQNASFNVSVIQKINRIDINAAKVL